MRHLTDTKEVNCEDDAALDPTVSAAQRSLASSFLLAAADGAEANTVPSDSCSAKPPLENPLVHSEWVGIMGFTPDLNPLVGPLQANPSHFIAAGYSGHGMPIAFLAGAHIAELVCQSLGRGRGRGGGEGDDADGPPPPIPHAFRPARFNL